MWLKFITIFIIVLLIFTNGITDAPNAIATLVGAKVMNFRKAAFISAIFNLIGIIVMSFVNISVANCISSVVNLYGGVIGIICLISAMISVIIFALVAMLFGIPTSETHGLIAGLTGSGIALYGIRSISFHEWFYVLFGLFFSVCGTLILSYIISKILKNVLSRAKDKTISNFQVMGMCAMSFMHGAQDGQKFIGILILYNYILKNMKMPETINPKDNVHIIIFVAIIMFIGVSIGGKKIVQNIGDNMTKLTKRQALCSDIVTSATLMIASFNGLPVSTTHVKTVSIIGIGKCEGSIVNKDSIMQVFKAWLLTFPVCLAIAYLVAKFFKFVL